MSYLVNGVADAEVLQSHLLLLAAVFLHEGDEAGALAIPVTVLLQVNDELRILREGRVVAAATGRLLGYLPTPQFDDSIPILHCGKKLAGSSSTHCYMYMYMLHI